MKALDGRLTKEIVREVVSRARRRLSDLHVPDDWRPSALAVPWHKKKERTNWGALLLAGAVGAVLAFLLDPDRGRRRRAVGRDKLFKLARRGGRQVGRLARHTASDVHGLAERVTHEGEAEFDVDDATLSQRVQSEIFRDPGIPKGKVNVNVENGVVVLRGELDSADQITILEEQARRIPGVLDVRSLLHVSVDGPE